MTEKNYKGGDFSRPAPPSPRGHPKKKPRREGPPKGFRPREDVEWPRPPPSLSPPADHFTKETPPDSKPLRLGGYVVQHGPSSAPEFKIRGRSLAAPKSEEGCDGNQEPASLGNLETAFVTVANSIFSHVQNIEAVILNNGYPPTHPISRAAARIKAQLDRLSDVYQSMGTEVEGMAHELDQFAAREGELKRELDGSRATNFKLSCANKDLADQVHDFRCTAAETELELRRLKRTNQGLDAKHERLAADHRELEEDRKKTEAEKLWLEDAARKQRAELEKAANEHRRLQVLVQEREEKIEGLKSDSLGLQTLVHQRGVEIESVRVENLRLQSLLLENEARLSSLTALPTTPLSPMVSLGSYFSGGPAIPQLLPPRPVSPLPYIKQEAPEQTPSEVAFPSEPPAAQLQDQGQPLYQSAAQPQDATQLLHQLGTGTANVLAKLFLINHRTAHNPVLINFLTYLGAASELPPSFTTVRTATRRPWHLQTPWLPTPTPAPILHPTLEEQFTHLCLLFPFTGTTTAASIATNPTTDPTDSTTFHCLTALLASLTKADHSASPHAAEAFLQTAAALFPPRCHRTAGDATTTTTTRATTATAATTAMAQMQHHSGKEQRGTTLRTTRTVLLAMMLCELCRVLDCALPSRSTSDGGAVIGGRRGQRWEVSDFFGPEVWGLGVGAGGMTPLRRFAAALSESHGMDNDGSNETGGEGLKERLARECGDQFCLVRTTAVASPDCPGREQPAAGESSSSPLNPRIDTDTATAATTTDAGVAREAREIGLLHCDPDGGEFLLLDFKARGIRVVDCALAGMRPNAAEPRKLDLIVARAGDAAGWEGRTEEEELLWTAAAAPRDVAAFWVRYAMGDV